MNNEKESIQDIFGRDILPGSIIAISRGNRESEQELSVVTGFAYRGRHWQGRGKIVNLIRLGWSWGGRPPTITKGWLHVGAGFNDDVIVVEPSQAFLALNNKRIQGLIQAVDIAKDEGLLPSDYKLGTPFSDEQIFPEKE
jgi:hypothetical protein